MQIELWWIGKTKAKYLDEGLSLYLKRLKHYCSFSTHCIDDVKNAGKLNPAQLKQKEAEKVLNKLSDDAYLILLDEKGTMPDSIGMSEMIRKHFNYSSKKLIFLIGGAFGFDESIYKRAAYKLSLSKMTFSHQMVRLFFVEQLYRAFTIINNEKYHNS